VVSVIFIGISGTDYFIQSTRLNHGENFINVQRNLENLETELSFSFSSLHESLSQVDPNFSYDGKSLVEFYVENMLESKRKLLSSI
jgi:hypothetical protein